jgi:hypothetical protein
MREITGKLMLQGSGDGLADIAVLAFDVSERAAAPFRHRRDSKASLNRHSPSIACVGSDRC